MIIQHHEQLVGQGLIDRPIQDGEKFLPQVALGVGLAIAQRVEVDAHVAEPGFVNQLEMFILEIAPRAVPPERVPADDVHAPAQKFILPERVSPRRRETGR